MRVSGSSVWFHLVSIGCASVCVTVFIVVGFLPALYMLLFEIEMWFVPSLCGVCVASLRTKAMSGYAQKSALYLKRYEDEMLESEKAAADQEKMIQEYEVCYCERFMQYGLLFQFTCSMLSITLARTTRCEYCNAGFIFEQFAGISQIKQYSCCDLTIVCQRDKCCCCCSALSCSSPGVCM